MPNDYIEWLLGSSTDERMLKLIELATGKILPSEEDQNEKLKLIVEFNDLVQGNDTGRANIYKYYIILQSSACQDEVLLVE